MHHYYLLQLNWVLWFGVPLRSHKHAEQAVGASSVNIVLSNISHY